MMVPLTQLEIAGLRSRLDDALGALQELRLAEVVTVVDPGETPPDLAELIARTDAILTLGDRSATGTILSDTALRTTLDHLEPQVAKLLAEDEELRGEAEALPRSIAALDALQPLVPELGRLNDRQLANLGLASMALVLDDPDLRIVPELTRQLAELLGRGHLMVTSTTAPGSPVGCLLVLRRRDLPKVDALLGTERIVEVGVPAAYAGKSLRATVEAMRERLAVLPRERNRVRVELVATVMPATGPLRATIAVLRARVERAVAAAQADVSSRTFVLRLWVPAKQTARVEEVLADRLGSAVAVERLDTSESVGDQPVLLRNRPGWEPFQQLVGLLSWPARGDLDPTGLTALVLPIFFGVMVGDVVYGALLLAAGWWLRLHWSKRTLGEVGRVMVLGGAWTVLFGVLYGEALGSLGHRVGMPALWFYRGGPTALEPLLLFALAIGLVHVVLGLVLGVWTAARGHHRRPLASKLGTLLVLAGLFGMAGVAAAGFPAEVLTPAVAALVVGVVVACVSQGALGLLLGPLDLLGALGNVLSYLRLAAVGLASTYLAEVANQLGARGPLLLGLLVATLFHALNLALAAFSPTIQALRLHYVEFFGQFYEGGGRLFAPLGGGSVAEGPESGSVPVSSASAVNSPEPVPAGSSV
ncbi:V-type ATPase 116kDa subunit family protein [Kribbella sp. VKM Ac-2566]|uniref:V-type ATPase 116kDa subunit family protein n=1 Tax=Kribbella sp. VKM Ac-2566 TaxID=2512218 RepID=UPI0010627E48|nr:V-type ATPase 116kDa subunit family protein [Kribbella sp. VKM Ac-2566]TDW79516.1 V/A-type H+-transporting ATPase subunit I [Kribbella sp. VKM Ac-2566]